MQFCLVREKQNREKWELPVFNCGTVKKQENLLHTWTEHNTAGHLPAHHR